MGQQVVIDGLAGWVALVLPLAALLTAIAFASRARSRARTAAPKSTGRYGERADPAAQSPPPPQPGSTLATAGETAPPAKPVKPASDGWFPKVVGRAQRRYAQKTEPKFPEFAKARSPETLKADIARAERDGEEAKLPSLFIALAGHRMAAGDVTEASELLRKSIRLAVSLGRDNDHARARLELGDIARSSGDLTTACEHWQIARRLFHGLSQPEQLASAETRMSEHGCPTDWVLNDF